MKKHLRSALLASTALAFLVASPAHAADGTAETLKALQAQINALQKQLGEMQAKDKARAEAEAARAAAPAPAAQAASADPGKKEILPGVSVKVGGFVAMEGVYRDKNQTTDMASNLGTSIPFNNQTNAHTDEFRGSARQTRLSLLAEGKPDADTKLGAYVEADFSGSGSNSSSVQTNNYVPRLRHAYATVDRDDWGFQFVAGQTFSLATLYKSGLGVRQEAGVVTIDGAGPPGYVYTRAPLVRAVKSFDDKKLNVGLSIESPQVNYGSVITQPAGITAYNTSTSVISSSTDFAPDVIAKVAYDTSIGHFEVFGLTRFFRDVVNATGHNNYAMGAGGGAGAFIPVVPKKLEVMANFLAGKGIGRYSSAQLPDYAFTATGGIKPLEKMAALFGVIAHPTPTWDAYLYVGGEKIMREDAGAAGTSTGIGYGNFNLNNSGCNVIGGTCQGQTETVWQVTPGVWKTVYAGDYGNMKVGAQYSLTRRDAFSGANNQGAHAFENIGMMSFRYAPF